MAPAPSRDALYASSLREGAVISFERFAKHAWPHLQAGTDLSWNWHLSVLCLELEHLIVQTMPEDYRQRVGFPTIEEYRERLGIALVTTVLLKDWVACVPPRSLKTVLVQVLLNGWEWLHNPRARWLSISVDEDLGAFSGRQLRELVETPWYQSLVEHQHQTRGMPRWTLAAVEDVEGKKKRKKKDTETYYETSVGGSKRIRGVFSKITGKGAHRLVIDDPIDMADVVDGTGEQIARRLKKIVARFDSVWSSRFDDPKTALRFLIMQRAAQGDLAGVLISRGARAVVFPQEFDPDFPAELGGVHPLDPRTERGELLHQARYDAAYIADAKSRGPDALRHYEAQHNQRPMGERGELFDASWFGLRFKEDPQRLQNLDEVLITVDAAFKKREGSSYVVLAVWARRGWGDRFLLDLVRRRMSYLETEQATYDLWVKWRHLCGTVLIEDKANGTAVLDALRKKVPTLQPYEPAGSKYARASIWAAILGGSSVRVWFPENAPWLSDYIVEHVRFRGVGDETNDQVDASSMQAVFWNERQGDAGTVNAEHRWLGGVSAVPNMPHLFG